MTPSGTKKTEAGGYAKISDCYVHMWYICYCYCNAGLSLGGLMYIKTKTLNSGIISVGFFSCFKKFKCLGDVLDSEVPSKVLSFRRFYNLAQILI